MRKRFGLVISASDKIEIEPQKLYWKTTLDGTYLEYYAKAESLYVSRPIPITHVLGVRRPRTQLPGLGALYGPDSGRYAPNPFRNARVS